MWDNVGIIRTPKKLQQSITLLNDIKKNIYRDIDYYQCNSELYSLRNAIDTGILFGGLG